MSIEGRFASLFSAFEQSSNNNSHNCQTSCDISNVPNEEIYSNFIHTLKDNGSSPQEEIFTCKPISLSLDNLADFDDKLLDENNIARNSSEEFPSYDNIANENVLNDSAQNWSPNSKFKNLSEMMNTLLLKDEEDKNNADAIIEINQQLKQLETTSNLIFDYSVDDDNDDDYNQTTEEVVSNLVSNLIVTNTNNHSNSLNKISYCGTCGAVQSAQKNSSSSITTGSINNKVFYIHLINK